MSAPYRPSVSETARRVLVAWGFTSDGGGSSCDRRPHRGPGGPTDGGASRISYPCQGACAASAPQQIRDATPEYGGTGMAKGRQNLSVGSAAVVFSLGNRAAAPAGARI